MDANHKSISICNLKLSTKIHLKVSMCRKSDILMVVTRTTGNMFSHNYASYDLPHIQLVSISSRLHNHNE